MGILTNFLKNRTYQLIFLTLVGFFLLLPNLKNGFNLDDSYIFQYLPKGEKSVFSVFNQRFDFVDYRPILIFSYALEQKFFGEINPEFAHLINVLLYLVIVLLIYQFISLLNDNEKPVLAFLISFIFLIHPIHANVVSNLKSRDNLLSALFYLLACIHLLKGVVSEKFNWKHVTYATLFFLLALFSKLDAIGFIFIAPVLLFFFRTRKLKFLLFGTLIMLACYVYLRDTLIYVLVPPDKVHAAGVIFTENPLALFSAPKFVLGQTVTTLFTYLHWIFIPQNYLFYYGYDMIPLQSIAEFPTLLKLLLNIAVIGLIFYAYKKGEKLISFGLIFIYINLLYCANAIMPVAGIVADRYAFIASVGGCIVIGKLIYNLLYQWNFIQPTNISKAFIGVLLAISLLFMPSTYARIKDWKSIYTLLESDMPGLKRSFQANRIAVTHILYKAKELEMSDPKEAKIFYEKGLEYATDASLLDTSDVFVHESKGICLFGLKRYAEAFNTFQYVNRLTDSSLVSQDLCGDLMFMDKQYQNAALFYKNALILDPLNEDGIMKYITALINCNQNAQAHLYADSLILNNQKFTIGYEAKGFIHLMEKDTLKASVYFEEAFSRGLESKVIAHNFKSYWTSKNNKEKENFYNRFD